MAGLDRRRLIELLEVDGVCEARAAVDELHAGAEFTFYDALAQPAEHLARIYRRRAEHVRRIGLDAHGLDAAVERFEAADEVGALAVVHGDERDYSVFLAPSASSRAYRLQRPRASPAIRRARRTSAERAARLAYRARSGQSVLVVAEHAPVADIERCTLC
jgi:hypothetical protein